jgi:LuxR family maltose regulon positive regulatory protein
MPRIIRCSGRITRVTLGHQSRPGSYLGYRWLVVARAVRLARLSGGFVGVTIQANKPVIGAGIPLVMTRLHPPALPHSMLTRSRLGRALDRAHRQSVTLVKAPPGFGKTTAVADWVYRHEETDRIAWLTVGTDDDDPQRFWLGFVRAVAAVESTALTDSRQKLNQGEVFSGETLSAELVNGLCAITKPITVVIDDFENIANLDVMKSLEFVIKAMPPTVHLMLCSRTEPDLPVSTWRAAGLLSEIRTEDLRFTDNEAGAYLDLLIAGTINAEQERAVLQKNQGWIAGLHLTALGIERASDPASFVDGFSGADHLVADYVVEDVLSDLSEGMRSFLLETSILTTMSAPLCDAVTNRADSAAMLQVLLKHSLFVTARAGNAFWTYHPLFRDVLRTQLANKVGLAGLAELHRRAARSYLSDLDFGAALEHAVAADDFCLARKILEDHHMDLLCTSPNKLRTALAAIPDDVLAAWPRGRSVQIAVAAALADTDGLEAIVGREAIGGARSLELVARNMLSYLKGDYVQIEQSLRQSGRAMHPDARDALHGLAATANGQYEYAASILRSATGRDSSDAFMPIVLTGILAWNRVRAGQLSIGAAFARRALTRADNEGMRWFHGVRWAELAQAHVKFDRGQLDDAYRDARLITEQAASDGWSRVEAHLLTARISWARGDRPAASQHLATAALAPTGPVSGALARMIALVQAHLCVLDGDLELAAAWLPDWQTRIEAGPTEETERLVLARLLVESQRIKEALDLLESCTSQPSTRYLIEAAKVKAIAALRSGDSSAPLLLEVALAMARVEGFVQTFVDDWRVLAQIGSPSDIAVFRPVATGGRSVPVNGISVERDHRSPVVEPLTDRELTVLEFLPTRLTNQEIAEELFISINTVKTHVKAIYRKLEVGDRTAAVDSAVSMRLV